MVCWGRTISRFNSSFSTYGVVRGGIKIGKKGKGKKATG
jgi:hypothetical protein